ncbi:thiamine phosphate synthase [Maioricimonas rarisocia]|nr:thiamine phosphate synthase [Maioricimonas rarisocia]
MARFDGFSEGARRVLDAADRLAHDDNRSTWDSRHLLHALWTDESRAAELMRQAGLTQSALNTGFPLASIAPDRRRETNIVESTVDYDELLRRQQSLLGASRRIAADREDIGTEFLLAGLLAVDADLASRLAQIGVDANRLASASADPSLDAAEPIDVQIELRSAAVVATDEMDTSRVLDAAANRAREGLRVVEDFVRFVLDDAGLSERLKTLRHRLRVELESYGGADLMLARDTQHDVGTQIQTATESRRESPRSVLLANTRRVQEALRTLEEFGKRIEPTAAAAIGQLRYDFYTIERAVYGSWRSRERLQDAHLYLLATDGMCARGLGPAVKAALAGGVDVVQLREKNLTDRRLIELARMLRDWTLAADVLLIINDRPDIAALVNADGVHLGQDDMPVREARRIVGGEKLIGVSTHHLDQARQAVLDGADYLGVGPTFPSVTKSFSEFAGLDYIRAVADEVSLPWFAIGGISLENARQVHEAGGRRIAVSSAICSADDPEAAARQLRAAVASAP